MSFESRLPNFHEKTLLERAKLIAERIQDPELRQLLGGQSLSVEIAEKLSENVIGVLGFPLSIATNFIVNGEEILVPMSVEEPSVVAAASFGAKLARAGGGFFASTDDALMVGQIELRDIPNIVAAEARVQDAKERLLAEVNLLQHRLVSRGGGARDLTMRILEPREAHAVCEILIDCRDAMGANLINTTCEFLAGPLAELTGGVVGLRILSNFCDRRRARARTEIPIKIIGAQVAEGISLASRFAERDVWRAVTHNKGFMNGVDAVVVATGNDFRAVEAAAHASAAKDGTYKPLARWWATHDSLIGEAEIPLSLGTVGGATEAHPGARLALAILGNPSAKKLAEITVAAGLAQNLSALRALATDGIQKGHMALHARRLQKPAAILGHQFSRWFAPKIEQIEKALRELFEKKRQNTASIVELLPALAALEEFTLRGGKRVRAALMLLGYEVSGHEIDQAAVEASLSFELLQSALLIQEDLIEGESLRRGAQTMHRALTTHEETSVGLSRGEALALVVSDLAQSYAFEQLFSAALPQELRLSASQELLSCVRDVFAGKWRDLRIDAKDASDDDIKRAYELRGGRYHAAGPLCLGARLGGASPELLHALEQFGVPLGVAFQMQDEILSLFGAQSETGRSGGAELKPSRPRMLLVEALRRCEKQDAQTLQEIIRKKTITSEEQSTLKDLLLRSGAKEAAEQRAQALMQEAKQILIKAPLSVQHRTLLADLADFVVNRAS
jgi:hydroxymethylglutaryl-CoA reductase